MAAAMLRLPWKRRHVPFLLAHLGILVLLLGCWTTLRYGREAKMIIAEGTTADTAILSKQWQFETNYNGAKKAFPFSCGPLSRQTFAWNDWKKNVVNANVTGQSKTPGFVAAMSRLIANTNDRAIWLLAKLVASSPRSFQVSDGVTVEVLDWLVNSDFKPVEPLVLHWEAPNTAGNDEKTPARSDANGSKLTLAFSAEGEQSADTLSPWATRKTDSNGVRVVLRLAQSNQDTQTFLKAIPLFAAETKDAKATANTNSNDKVPWGNSLQLVLLCGTEVFRFDGDTLIAMDEEGDPALRLAMLNDEENFIQKRLARKDTQIEKTVKDGEISDIAKQLRDMERLLQRSEKAPDLLDRQKFETLFRLQARKARLMRLEHNSTDVKSFQRELRSWLDEVTAKQKSMSVLAEKVKLGKTGYRLANVQLTPTHLPGQNVLQGMSAVIQIAMPEGKLDMLRLHSEYPEANTSGKSTGISGTLWAQIDSKTQKYEGYSWGPDTSKPRLELLQSTDDVLYYRYWDAKTHVATGTAISSANGKRGQTFGSEKITPQVPDAKTFAKTFQITKYQFMDEPGIQLVTAPVRKETADEFYAKVRLKVTTDSGSETFWLRTVPQGSVTSAQEVMLTKKLRLSSGELTIALTNKRIDPGFSLHVRKFKADYEPGSTTPSSFSSLVDYTPHSVSLDTPEAGNHRSAPDQRLGVVIRMNQPGVFADALRGGNWWAYQDSFRGPFFPGDSVFDSTVNGALLPNETTPRQRLYQTVITLNCDPGRGLKYFGSLLIVLGTGILIYRHPRRQDDGTDTKHSDRPNKADTKPAAQNGSPSIATKLLAFVFTFTIVVLFLLLKTGTVSAEEPPVRAWSAWRSLPVMSDGRRMPLDTFSRIAVREICGTPSPVLSLDETLLTALRKDAAIGLPPLDEFLASGKYSPEEKDQLKQWYASVSFRMITRQKEIAKRLSEMFPTGSRRFEHYELLFRWLCEPDVWEYIPFIADQNNIVGSSVLQKKTPNRFLAPCELDDARYTEIVQTVLDHHDGHAPTRAEADLQLRKLAAVAKTEAASSYFRALSFNPEKDASPLVGYYFDAIMVPAENGTRPALIEKLDQSIKELLLLTRQEEKTLGDSPFLKPDFLLAKMTPLQTDDHSRQGEVILLMRQLNLIAKIYRENPLAMNAVICNRVYTAVAESLSAIRKHRDIVFKEQIGSKAYREVLLRVVYWTEEIADRIRLASGALTDNGRYVVRKHGKARSEHIAGPTSQPVWSVPACVELEFTTRDATMKIMPSLGSAVREAGEDVSSPWVSIQTVLYAPDCLYQRFVDTHLPSTANEKQPSRRQKEISLSVCEALNRLCTDGNPARADRKAFYAAANTFISGKDTDHWGTLLDQFAQSLRRIAETNASALAQQAAAQSDDAQAAATLVAKLSYPLAGELDAELFYTRLNAFYWNWVFCFIAFCFLVASLVCGFIAKPAREDRPAVTRRPCRMENILYVLGGCFLVCSCIVTFLGGAARAWITGWAPVTNMFETVVLLGFLVALFSLAYAVWPAFGPTISNAWQSAGLLAFRRRNPQDNSRWISWMMLVPHLLLIGLTLWGTVYICYREHTFDEGILKAVRDSFAMQGILDRAAVTAAMLFVIWFVPRCIMTIIVAICFKSVRASQPEGLWSSIIARREQRIVLLAGTAFALAIGMLAFFNTVEFNPNIRPLTAVLRSNFWLTIHVLAIIVSYALGTIAWGISLVMLGAFIFRTGMNSEQTAGQDQQAMMIPPICRRLAPVVLNLIRSVVLFLTLGIILGARWADFSWGHFWSWDPKEVWALVTLLIYLVVLHDRRRHERGVFGLAAGAVLGAFAIIMTWYGLSFVFGGGGRHAYVSGESHKTLALFILLGVNLLWTFLAWYRLSKPTERSLPLPEQDRKLH